MFGAGCFWGIQQIFAGIRGVLSTVVGYSGGNFANPSYEDVCSGSTGHAEVVMVEYDPLVVSTEDLLRVFWKSHNPTTINRQGVDIGSQYRSAVYYYEDEQREAAESGKADLERTARFERPIVTEIRVAEDFYPAEEYHQHYLAKRGGASCH